MNSTRRTGSDREAEFQKRPGDPPPGPGLNPMALPLGLDTSEGPSAPSNHTTASVTPRADGASSTPPGSPPILTATAAPEPEPDPFDPARFRRSQDFAARLGIKKHITIIQPTKPSKEWWVRTSPDPEFWYQTHVVELKEDRELYLVVPDLWDALATEPTFSPRVLVWSVNRQGVPFLWPIRLPGDDGKLDSWSQSAMDAAGAAKSNWVRVTANMSLQGYEFQTATARLAEPAWPDLGLGKVLETAFRGKLIDSWDHDVLRRLRGEV